MGLKESEIFFDNQYNTYYAGQTVNGRVVFTFDSPKKVRGIYISIKGEANTSWFIEESRTNNENRTENERINLTGHEEYFKNKYYLIGNQGGGEVEIPAGQQVYPFTCVLPSTLPSSFEGERGSVRYTVKVVIDRPWKFDQEVKAAFTVLSPVDLNGNPNLREPYRITMEKYFCCCWCKSGPLTVVVNVPCRGFVPGQTIPLVAEVDNISDVEVGKVSFSFQKVVTYYSQTPRRETCKDTIVLEKIQVGPVPGHESKTWNQTIVIPSLPPSNLMNCSLMDLDYEIYVEVNVSGFHTNLTDRIPLTIGTIPLSGLAGVPPASAPPAEVTNGPDNSEIGWNATGLYPSIPKFTPTEFGATNIRDAGDNEYTRFTNDGYKPMYPVYNFGNNPQ